MAIRLNGLNSGGWNSLSIKNLFSGLNTTGFNSMSSMVSDYNLIRSGSYGKLLGAYYDKMNKESFITLNIYYNRKDRNILINHYPIIFYWNGEDDIIENMKSNKDFFDYLSKNCFNVDLYPIIKISFVQFNSKRRMKTKVQKII